MRRNEEGSGKGQEEREENVESWVWGEGQGQEKVGKVRCKGDGLFKQMVINISGYHTFSTFLFLNLRLKRYLVVVQVIMRTSVPSDG